MLPQLLKDFICLHKFEGFCLLSQVPTDIFAPTIFKGFYFACTTFEGFYLLAQVLKDFLFARTSFEGFFFARAIF